MQMVLPPYLRGRFIQAALNYIGCKSRGQFVCRASDCWCQCSAAFPQCNCPLADLQALEASLRGIRDAWTLSNLEFQQSGGSMMGISMHIVQCVCGDLALFLTSYIVKCLILFHLVMWLTDFEGWLRKRTIQLVQLDRVQSSSGLVDIQEVHWGRAFNRKYSQQKEILKIIIIRVRVIIEFI